MKRLFGHRYPYYGEDHEGMGKLAIIGGSVVAILAGLLSLNKWRETELAKRSFEKYQAIDPNQIVPYAKDLQAIDSEKLLRAVTDGGDKFIYDEIGYKLFASPEEYVFNSTRGIKAHEKDQFLEYVRNKISEL